jgi:hypothetical protein
MVFTDQAGSFVFKCRHKLISTYCSFLEEPCESCCEPFPMLHSDFRAFSAFFLREFAHLPCLYSALTNFLKMDVVFSPSFLFSRSLWTVTAIALRRI